MCALWGCQQDKVIFDEDQEIPGAVWAHDMPLDFTFAVKDTTTTYRLLLDITHSEDYQWENFYTRILTSFPQDSVKEDIVSLELASNIGSWYGKCRSNSCTVTIPLQQRVRFANTGEHTLSFEQYMRVPQLQGIEKLRLRLVKPKE